MDYLTTKEVMTKYGVSRQTIFRWRRKNYLKATLHTGGKVLFLEKDLLKFEALIGYDK
jgi:predicted site-specific integrase-resolvase